MDNEYTITSVSKTDNITTTVRISPNFRDYSDKMVDNPIFITFSDNPMEENGYGLTLGAAKRLAKDLNEIVDSCNDKILDNEEREYLGNIIKPFKNNKIIILKQRFSADKVQIVIIVDNDFIKLPLFDINSPMYKRMEIGKYYTLQELNLM